MAVRSSGLMWCIGVRLAPRPPERDRRPQPPRIRRAGRAIRRAAQQARPAQRRGFEHGCDMPSHRDVCTKTLASLSASIFSLPTSASVRITGMESDRDPRPRSRRRRYPRPFRARNHESDVTQARLRDARNQHVEPLLQRIETADEKKHLFAGELRIPIVQSLRCVRPADRAASFRSAQSRWAIELRSAQCLRGRRTHGRTPRRSGCGARTCTCRGP